VVDWTGSVVDWTGSGWTGSGWTGSGWTGSVVDWTGSCADTSKCNGVDLRRLLLLGQQQHPKNRFHALVILCCFLDGSMLYCLYI